MKIISKVSLISLAVAATMAVAPTSAFAHKTGKAHKHATTKAVKKSSRSASASAPVSSTDARLRQMESEIQALRGELGRTRSETKSAVNAVAEKSAAQDAAIEAKLVKHEDETYKKNTIFFRGGYAAMAHNRNGELLVSNNALLNNRQYENNGGSGWYIGAGFDHRITNDLFGMTDLLAVDAELMVQYMNFGSSTNSFVTATVGGLGVPGVMQNQVTQLTVSASPKIKFNTGTIFTPWVIPFGLSVNVISPPSSGVTVLNPGLMLGVGGEAEFMKAIVAGVDFRYNFTGGDLSYKYINANGQAALLNGVSTDGLTAGGYLGFKF